MEKNLKVIDLMTGIGGRALGFQQAGYNVIYAIEQEPVCKDIYNQILKTDNFILSSIENISLKNLPESDVISAKLQSGTFKNIIKKDSERNVNEVILEIIVKKSPKAFVLEVPSGMITNNRSAELRSMLGLMAFQRYRISYRIIEEADFSGFPVVGKQAYIVGIRNDLGEEEFYFTNSTHDGLKRSVFKEDEYKVDDWYRKIKIKSDIEYQNDFYYINERGKVSLTSLIHMGIYREMYLVDSIGLRKFTHNECAALKGLEGYDFNKCTNKQHMYMKIAYASNVYIVNSIANDLKKYLDSEYTVGEKNRVSGKSAVKSQVKETKQKSTEGVPKQIFYPKHKIINIHVDELKGIKNLDIFIEKNMTAIMGVNGAGKSTILHALACIYEPFRSGDNYKFSFFFTPNPDSSWKNSKLSITYWDENLQKEITREYKKNNDRWAPRYADRPKRDLYFIGIETCIPEIERERQTSYIDYKTSLANDKISCKLIKTAAYVLNKNYDNLNYHKTKKKDLLGVHTTNDMRYSSLSMGAGEQRVLKILKTVYTANTHSLILIDEIDILLHVTALKRLICMLSELATERSLQIIFTTHSLEISKMKEFVDIRYLEPLKEKTMVYDAITPDIVYELSENFERTIKIYVEDILAEIIVNVVADDLEMSRNVNVIKIGAASNAFVLASSFILQEEDTANILILLDGDVYRNEKDKSEAIKKVLSGTEKEHDNKISKAVELIHQLILPENTEPEKYIFDMLIELDDKKEIVEAAKKLKAVSNSHQWLDKLVTRMGKNEELVLYKIIDMVSEHEKWGEYVREIRQWLINRKEFFQL